MAQAKAHHTDWKDRFFNVGFILDPEGEVILKHYKVSPLFPVEHSVCPHDIFDWWVEKYGLTLDAFWPVADTEIGRLGIMMANEGSYPENARALAMNGAEVVYRGSYPHPATGNGFFENERGRHEPPVHHQRVALLRPDRPRGSPREHKPERLHGDERRQPRRCASGTDRGSASAPTSRA